MINHLGRAIVASVLALGAALSVSAQDYAKYSDEALREELAELADAEVKVLVPMRDGVGLASNIYRPKDAEGPLPTIFWRTPYNFNELAGTRLRQAVEAVSRGYAFVLQNERGRYYSEGEFEILGYPQTDGYDALDWIAEQDWSNGKVGTIGCSSSAEWQLALAAQAHPAHAAMVPMASGAGIGRVGEFYEQGNWYTGGVERNLFFVWLYNVDNPLRAQIPGGLDPETRAHIGGYNDLAATKPEVDWTKQIKHLPVTELLSDLGEPPGTFEAFIPRKPNDPGWYEGGLYHDDMGWGVPALWFNSWYDVSIGPNMALFNHVRENGDTELVRDNQYVVAGPNVHCRFLDYGPDYEVGELNVGDTSFDTIGLVYQWFDHWLKDDHTAWTADIPKVQYYTLGAGEWRSDETWPPQGAEAKKLYLHSEGAANSHYGDGKLSFDPPEGDQPTDRFAADPLNPVLTIGGGDCCNGGIVQPGPRAQRSVSARADVLVYTSDPLEEPLEVTGFTDALLHVSSDAKDADFAVKLVDVHPDGAAYIVDDTILRARYREGYDQEVFMTPDEIYALDFTPMTSSIVFDKGHRIRVEIAGSNFPKFVRNLNTGGDVVDETEGVVATSAVHHTAEHPSYLVLPVVE
ncbi:MAG: CocE/NonD family hydrolase [Maricaulaceae bacterium]